jgi:choline kinase
VNRGERNGVKVAMLAAGVGRRLDLYGQAPPKALLRFAGESLLQRHLDILAHFGLFDVTLVVGHRADEIRRELTMLRRTDRVQTRFNPDYRISSLLSLWALRDVFAAGEPVLYMDADVLYDWRLLARLLDAPEEDCLLVDRAAADSEEALKVCIREGRVVDFHKRIRATSYDHWWEWIGFARFSAESAGQLADALQSYVDGGRTEVIYEEPMRDVILAGHDRFGTVDSLGLPWIEIDFQNDLQRARIEVLPRLVGLPASHQRRASSR